MYRRETAYVSIDLIVGEICLYVSIVTRACLGKRVNLGCLGVRTGSGVVRGFPSLRVVLGIFLRAEPEAPAASRARVISARLRWFGATLWRWLSTRG